MIHYTGQEAEEFMTQCVRRCWFLVYRPVVIRDPTIWGASATELVFTLPDGVTYRGERPFVTAEQRQEFHLSGRALKAISA